jgi:hypothetical protein
MNDDGRVYFIGAGASKQDRFPLTGELKHGLAWAIREEPERFALLAKHLEYLYHVRDETFEKSAAIWENLSELPSDAPPARCQIPDVTDLLSTLDWIIREQSSFGPGLESHDEKRSPIDELPEVRDLVVQALCYCLSEYHRSHNASATEQFVKLIAPTDSLITTNWDLLLDATRHGRFGSDPADYGTLANVVLEGAAEKESVRPKLLKLHGSLSWRYCQRCQRLVIDPLRHVAGERNERCECTYTYSELIVTPGFVREYRNIHLLTIWREALEALAKASHWIFIGYSLPPDDVAIRTLLLKARCVRKDIGGQKPRVSIVTGSSGEQTRSRYLGIFADVELFEGNFGQFVDQKGGGIM